MKWIKITKENITRLKPGNRIKYHDGFEWCEKELNEYNIDAGLLHTGIHSETRDLINRRNDKHHDVFVSEEDLLKNQQHATSNLQPASNYPNTPRFLFAPDSAAKQLYIIHTQFPLSIIWIDQNQVPARLFVTETELYPEDEDPQTAMPPDEVEILEQLLRDAAQFYRHNAVQSSN